jgi:DNA-binding HxlR family transcriptional regulator
LSASTIDRSGTSTRSGARSLSLLACPRNFLILQALAEGPKQRIDLRRAAGSPSQTTISGDLKSLEEIGAIVKHRGNSFPGSVEYELGIPGRELLVLAGVLERWLSSAPDAPLELGGEAAKAAIKTLVEGWSTTMMRALAARPLSLTQLDRLIGPLNYPALEYRLDAMRLAGQVEARPRNGRGTPWGVTDWLRRGVGPIVVAARWERRHARAKTGPITRLDIEAALLLAIPLLRLPAELSGSCRLGVEMTHGNEHRLAGAMVCVERGQIALCTVRLQGHPDAWTTGSVDAWLQAVIESDADQIEMGGDQHLASTLLESLHRALLSPETVQSNAA